MEATQQPSRATSDNTLRLIEEAESLRRPSVGAPPDAVAARAASTRRIVADAERLLKRGGARSRFNPAVAVAAVVGTALLLAALALVL